MTTAVDPRPTNQALPESRSGNAQLLVERLEVTYSHSIVALRGVTLTVRPGEIVALIGRNGAGKSTTLRAISHLLPAVRGQITGGRLQYGGRDLARTSQSELVRHGLAQVLEGRHCFSTLSVEENLVTGGLGRGSRRSEITTDLERIYAIFPRLKEKRRTLAGLTSGGEQQMLAIGRALMSRPKLLVLDEPSMGLAPLVVQTIFRTLKTLNQTEGLSLLVAEQNSAIALKYAHRIYVLETGATVLSATAEELKHRDDIKSFYLGENPVAVEPGAGV